MIEDDVSTKLYRRLGKKRYSKGKRIYHHERIYLPIPSIFHEAIKSLLDQRLKMDVTKKGGVFTITLHLAKAVRHAEQPSGKSPS